MILHLIWMNLIFLNLKMKDIKTILTSDIMIEAIAYFNRNYVKEHIFDKSISKLIDTAFRLREKADYQDFIIISKKQATEQLEKAEQIINMLKPYLRKKWYKYSATYDLLRLKKHYRWSVVFFYYL